MSAMSSARDTAAVTITVISPPLPGMLPSRYCDFPSEHWTRIRTNNVIERLNREIRRRTRVVGSFPDGNSALMLVCARLRHVAGTQWGNKKYMNMKHLQAVIMTLIMVVFGYAFM